MTRGANWRSSIGTSREENTQCQKADIQQRRKETGGIETRDTGTSGNHGEKLEEGGEMSETDEETLYEEVPLWILKRSLHQHYEKTTRLETEGHQKTEYETLGEERSEKEETRKTGLNRPEITRLTDWES